MTDKTDEPDESEEEKKQTTIIWGDSLDEFPEYARLIAAIIAEWNVVEFHFVNLLSALLKAPKPVISPMVFAIANNGARLDVLEAALMRSTSDEEILNEIAKLMKEARSLLKMRNTIAHAMYVVRKSPRKTQLMAMSFKRLHEGKTAMVPVPLHELESCKGRITNLAGDAFIFFQGIVGHAGSPMEMTTKRPPTSPESASATPDGPDLVYARKLQTRHTPPPPSDP